MDADAKTSHIEGSIGAVGLIVENVARHEALFVTMLCVPTMNETFSNRREGFAVPRAGRAMEDKLRTAALMRCLRPLIGELMHFAENLPGGIAVAGGLPGLGCDLPSAYAIQKKVLDKQWDSSIRAATVFTAAISGALPFVESCTQNLQALPSELGEVGSPTLACFAALVRDQSHRLARTGLVAEGGLPTNRRLKRF